MGLAYDDLLSPPLLGTDNVQEAIDVIKGILLDFNIANVKFVTVAGSDVTGNGTLVKPYATMTAAIAAITDAGPTKRYGVVVIGRVTEAVSVTLKPNVLMVGLGVLISRMGAASWEVDAAWTPAGDHRTGFLNTTVAGDINFDMNAVSSNEGKLYLFNSWVNNAINFVRFSAVNQWISQVARVFGSVNVNGGNFDQNAVVFQGPVTINEGPGGGDFQFSSDGCLFAALTFNAVAAPNAASVQGGHVTQLSVNGPIVIDASADNVPMTTTYTGGGAVNITTNYLSFAGSGVTGNRPPIAQYPVGWYYFDTTLGIPVWNNGVAWVDATGTPV